ncbi:DUF2079 domain-containing protein [Streptomyces sp. NPDC057242]|uniref:DUF2079 domain-containing protein n=1 Tax=unclassified Streptomyces TaxID=2593676 RepID=UPI003636735F
MNILNLSAVPSQRRAPEGGGSAPAGNARKPSERYSKRSALLLSGVFFLVYLALSARRHAIHLTTGYDLGIFTQIAKSYSEFTAPYAPLKGTGYNALGDHFHPILAILGPLYKVFPSSYTLLVCQAALIAVSVIPITLWALDVRGPKFAHWIGISYGASWGIAELVQFDFHEVAFAVPLLAFSVCAAGREKWRAAVLWAIPLVLVKEDLGLTVAAIGAYVAWKGPRRTGILLALFGAVATALAMFVVLPSVNPLGEFAYWPPAEPQEKSLLVKTAATFWPPVKWLTLLMTVAPTGFLAVRSPLLIVMLPTLGWRFTSDFPNYWGMDFHYSAVLMPVAFAAAVHAVASGRTITRRLLHAGVIGAVATGVTFFTSPFHELVLPRTWTTSEHVRVTDEILGKIPDGATVAASNRLAAQLAYRTTVSEVCLFPRSFEPKERPRWMVYDNADPSDPECATGKSLESGAPHVPGYRLVERRSGISLLERVDEPAGAPGGRP